MSNLDDKVKAKYKDHLCETAPNIKPTRLDHIIEIFKNTRNRDWESGSQNIYVDARLTDADSGKKAGLWPLLDIEDKDRHGDIEANIQAARSALDVFVGMDMVDRIRVMLTGSGFRFIFPFVVPQSYAPALIDFLKEIDGVDTSPLTGTMTRLAGYRGHRNQNDKGYPVKNVHIHCLQNPFEIFDDSFTRARYESLVAGPESKKQTLEYLPSLFPDAEMSEVWRTFLDPRREKLRMADAIISIPTVRIKTANEDAVLDYLTDTGIKYTKDNRDDYTFYKLAKCPKCGKTGKAWITAPAGRLKCYSGRCEAYIENGGLSPHQWIDGWEYPDTEPEPDPERETVSIEQARQSIRDAVLSDDDCLITMTPGAGKTTTTLISLAPVLSSQRVIFASPTKAKAAETYLDALKYCPDAHIRLIEGRNPQNCIRFVACESVAKRGYSPLYIICMSCPSRKNGECEYHNQFENMSKPGLYCMTHSAALYMKDEKNQETGEITNKFDTTVIDETPDQYFGEDQISLESLLIFKTGAGDAAAVIEKIQKAAERLREETAAAGKDKKGILYSRPHENIKDAVSIFEAAGINEAEKDSLLGHIFQFLPCEGETESQYQIRMFNHPVFKNYSLKTLKWFRILLSQIDGYALIEANSKRFKFTCQNKRRLQISSRIIILDGTGDKPSMDALFNKDFRLINGNVTLDGNKFVWVRIGCGKSSVKRMIESGGNKIEKRLRKSDEYIKTGDKILIITHKFAKESVLEWARKVWPDNQIDVIHFGGNRGLNEYKDHDVCILFGTMTMNPIAAYKRATLLFSDFAEQAKYIKHLSDSENIQSLHRDRPITGGKTIIIYKNAGGWLPGLPQPNVRLDLRRGNGRGKNSADDRAFERLKAFYQTFGWVNKSAFHMLGICCEREKESAVQFHSAWLEKTKKTKAIPSLPPQRSDSKPNINDFLPISKNHSGELILYKDYIIKAQQTRKNEMIIFGNNRYYKRLLNRMKAECLWSFLVKSVSGGLPGDKIEGIGSLDALEKFIKAFGGKFNRADWIEYRPDTEPETVSLFPAADVGIRHNLRFVSASRARMPFPLKPQVYDPPPPPARGIHLPPPTVIRKSGPNIASLPPWSRTVNHRALIRPEVMRAACRKPKYFLRAIGATE